MLSATYKTFFLQLLRVHRIKARSILDEIIVKSCERGGVNQRREGFVGDVLARATPAISLAP
jgi:hypothetical protein